MTRFTKTDRNKVRQSSKRGTYEQETIYRIIDEGLICHVGFAEDTQPYIIPILHARLNDQLILHGAPSSRLMRFIAAGNPICAAITLVDALVLAKSVFHHSVNYRSVVLFGSGKLLENDEDKLNALQVLTEHITPGRWQEARQPNRKELDATAVAAILIESASAKIRSGPPLDDPADFNLPIWSGVLPLQLQALPPEALPETDRTLPLPAIVQAYRR